MCCREIKWEPFMEDPAMGVNDMTAIAQEVLALGKVLTVPLMNCVLLL
ncbi:hypothetical protein [Cyclobacterium sp.]|nr:hypothetical protein [Cyclobacterium sp.]MBD3628556.1 hypothetical protein [Cyclobacterium sp.]